MHTSTVKLIARRSRMVLFFFSNFLTGRLHSFILTTYQSMNFLLDLTAKRREKETLEETEMGIKLPSYCVSVILK